MQDDVQKPERGIGNTLATLPPTSAAPARYRLDTLPTELLREIFWLAVELALLHSNHRFWSLTKTYPEPILPSYREFTEKLAGLAMCVKAYSIGDGGEDEVNVIGLKTTSLFSMPSAGLESTPERRLDPDK